MFFGYLDPEPWLERYLDFLCVRRSGVSSDELFGSWFCSWERPGENRAWFLESPNVPSLPHFTGLCKRRC